MGFCNSVEEGLNKDIPAAQSWLTYTSPHHICAGDLFSPPSAVALQSKDRLLLQPFCLLSQTAAAA